MNAQKHEPSEDSQMHSFHLKDLINLEIVQQIQDAFALSTGVASIITDARGNPITRPSNPSRICTIIRSTQKGRDSCTRSNRILEQRAINTIKPTYQRCLSCGFADARVPIIIDSRHIANWFVGQTNVMGVTSEEVGAYARKIGANTDEMFQAFDKMPQMSTQHFESILDLAWLLSREISVFGYSNLKRSRDMIDIQRAKNALKKSEQQFGDVLENSPDGIIILQDNQPVYQNPEIEKLLGKGYKPLDPQGWKMIHPDDRDKIKAMYMDLSTKKVSTVDINFRFHAEKNKEMRWAYCRANLIEYKGKHAIMVNIMDITRSKQMEHLLNIQDKMVSLGHVTAGIAHEIRNPLSGINLYLNALEKILTQNKDPEMALEIIAKMQSASSRIESVIRRVMDFAKPTEPNLVQGNINRPIREAMGLGSVTLKKAGICLEETLDDNLPLCRLDPRAIEQVVLNLITNAKEAMSGMDNNKKICIKSLEKNGQVQIIIADSGPGIPDTLRKRVFDPFYTTKNDSTGIGLSICHRIITDHKGTLNIIENPGGGAAFLIEIPGLQEKNHI